jgi:hypothetical protein
MAPPRTVVSRAKTSPAALSWATGQGGRADAEEQHAGRPGDAARRQRRPAGRRAQPEGGGADPEQHGLLGEDRDEDRQRLAGEDLAEAGGAGPQAVPGMPGSLVEQVRGAEFRRARRRLIADIVEGIGLAGPGHGLPDPEQVAARLLATEDGFRLHQLIDQDGTPADSFLRSVSALQAALRPAEGAG